ncbi:MAG: segregation/condensation protein A [Candidatus Krumholzibacteria bacterium]|nr:segregation/condensation protein A [Candidatus Krumholzibacteria bacterium]MDH4337157.1 segregation/condensation protein A [Candidatus Krumholzibacteria bacterium]MDH5269125.1 segregation/condensation protein A [Candidatus Krumholzibacteria bacterium]MDH5626820.1 segregation/condensation protein A [Candidatus Krumholzibacteria bacterium]
MAEAKPVQYTTELEGLRAPLGVILYLIRRDNLDIYDIPIARITREYLDYLNMIEGTQIELAGEFFVLAATLMRIKAQMLLRRDDDTDEDPRQELVQSLLEYKKMVEAARTFREIEEHRASIFTRPVSAEEKESTVEPVIDLSLFQLMRAFQDVMTQFEGADVREVELEQFTIEEKIAGVEEALAAREPVLFADLFAGSRTRLEVIVTFMAMLELLKHGHARVQQDASFGSIWIYKGANFGRPMGEVSDWSAEAAEPVEVAVASPTETPDGVFAQEEERATAPEPEGGPVPENNDLEPDHGESEPR